MSNYWDLPGFENVYLEDSWVTGINATPGNVFIEVDLVLREKHPAYSPPRHGEQYCYHPATIRFEGVSALSWTAQGKPAAVDGQENAISDLSMSSTRKEIATR